MARLTSETRQGIVRIWKIELLSEYDHLAVTDLIGDYNPNKLGGQTRKEALALLDLINRRAHQRSAFDKRHREEMPPNLSEKDQKRWEERRKHLPDVDLPTKIKADTIYSRVKW